MSDLFYGWHDDSKTPTAQKIADACAAYERRFERRPNVVLVNAAEVVAGPAGVQVQAAGYIRAGNFWAGWSEFVQPAAPPPPAAPVERTAQSIVYDLWDKVSALIEEWDPDPEPPPSEYGALLDDLTSLMKALGIRHPLDEDLPTEPTDDLPF